MYRLKTQIEFPASHQLIGYDGKCANLHGHAWLVEVFVIGEVLNEIGLLVDFGDIKATLKTSVTDRLDHSHLNDTKEIGNPSAENLARYIYRKLSTALVFDDKTTQLEKVRVWENARSYAEYFEGW